MGGVKLPSLNRELPKAHLCALSRKQEKRLWKAYMSTVPQSPRCCEPMATHARTRVAY